MPDRRIVMLTNAVAPDKLGGLERYVRELAAALVTAGDEVTVIAKRVSNDDAPRETGEDGVRIVRHEVPLKSDPLFAAKYPIAVARQVGRELERTGANAQLHVHFALSALTPVLRRRPFVLTFHAPVHRELLSERQGSYVLPPAVRKATVGAVRLAEGRVVRAAAQIITLSDFMTQQACDLHASARNKTTLLPGGIDIDRFRPNDPPVDDWAADASHLLVVARRLTPRTGVPQLVNAMTEVRRRHPRVRLAVLGDGAQRAPLAELIDRSNLNDCVRMFGRVSDDDLVDWYRRATLVVMPTQELEGFGLSTAEAMACGTPVLVTPVGANPELVRDLDPRLLANGTDPQSLANAISHLLDDPAGLESVRRHVRDVIDPDMAWAQIAEQHRSIYEKATPR